jgi:hypothetical protein
MQSNISKFESEIEAQHKKGERLFLSMFRATKPTDFAKMYKDRLGEKYAKFVESLPDFTSEYQSWYSDAQAVIKQVIPDRLADFVRHYEKPKLRKDIT